MDTILLSRTQFGKMTLPAGYRLTPLELLERLAALVPPPRVHRHRYYGVLAPNAPLRQVVTAMATASSPPAPVRNRPSEEPAPQRAARYAWAQLLARI